VEAAVLAVAAAAQPAAVREEAGNGVSTMRLKHFLNAIEHERVRRAIKAAERGTSADIVLYISHRAVEDPLSAAHLEFQKLHLETASEKNSLLIFLAPKSQKFAVVGGTALHAKLGQKWWDELIGVLTQHFKKGHYTDGIVATLAHAGHALQSHFPAIAPDRTGQKDIVEE
jgi:uncharacterized membrane protein